MPKLTDEPKFNVIEIHPDARYALIYDRRMTEAEMEYIHQRLNEWWKSGETFLIVAETGVKLVRVDE